MKLTTALLACALVLVSGCQTTSSHKPPEATDNFWSEMHSTKTENKEAKSTGGEIARHELNAFLDAGPPLLLRNVPVTPVLDGEELIGYRVEAFFVNDARFSSVDIVPGDVITAVNGSRLERPDDLFGVWEGLRTASRLQVDAIRGNTLRTLTWEIIDVPPPALPEGESATP